jgi:hypothetical protein
MGEIVWISDPKVERLQALLGFQDFYTTLGRAPPSGLASAVEDKQNANSVSATRGMNVTRSHFAFFAKRIMRRCAAPAANSFAFAFGTQSNRLDSTVVAIRLLLQLDLALAQARSNTVTRPCAAGINCPAPHCTP